MVEITQAQAQVVLDWDMAKRQGFNQAIAALEQPTPEMIADCMEQWCMFPDEPDMDVAHILAAAAKHLKEPTQ